jgi:hypothetical protein
MAINVLASGTYQPNTVGGIHSVTSFGTYSFFSGELTTTDDFEANILDFGVGLGEIWIVNINANALAFQFPDLYVGAGSPANVANLASGVVLGNDKIYFRKANKRGIKIRSLVTGSQTKAYIFGI